MASTRAEIAHEDRKVFLYNYFNIPEQLFSSALLAIPVNTFRMFLQYRGVYLSDEKQSVEFVFI